MHAFGLLVGYHVDKPDQPYMFLVDEVVMPPSAKPPAIVLMTCRAGRSV